MLVHFIYRVDGCPTGINMTLYASGRRGEEAFDFSIEDQLVEDNLIRDQYGGGTSYFDAVRALEDVDFPLVNLLKSKKDAGMDEVLDCFILDGPLADLPEAAHLQPCLEQLFVPIHHSDDKAIVGETSLSFALLNVHSRAEGAKKHAAALRQLMMEIVSNPLSSQTWVGETSTSAAPLSVEDFDEVDTDEDLGSVVAFSKFEACRF
ncbi:hypothetical protein Tco_0564188 [Tanacetum coccineum]